MGNQDVDTRRRLRQLEAEVARLAASPRAGASATRRPRRLVAVLAAVALLLPTVAVASDSFTDVPNSNPFHGAINAIAGAGITTGCGGSSFCPSASVPREQMAAFMQRGFGRAAVVQESLYGFWSEIADGTYGTLTIQTGGAAGGTGLLHVAAEVTAWTSQDALCPCTVSAFMDLVPTTEFVPSRYATLGNEAYDDYRYVTVPVSHTFVVPTGTTVTVRLRGNIAASGSISDLYDTSIRYGINAVYVPFDATGGNPSIPPGITGVPDVP